MANLGTAPELVHAAAENSQTRRRFQSLGKQQRSPSLDFLPDRQRSKQYGSGSSSRHHGHIKITRLKQTSQRHIRISVRTDPTSGADFQEFIVAQLQNPGKSDGFPDHVSNIEQYSKIGIEHT